MATRKEGTTLTPDAEKIKGGDDSVLGFVLTRFQTRLIVIAFAGRTGHHAEISGM